MTPDRWANLLDAAAAAFVEHGFRRTQMDDVAERLGVSNGTIYPSDDEPCPRFVVVAVVADQAGSFVVDRMYETHPPSSTARTPCSTDPVQAPSRNIESRMRGAGSVHLDL